MSDEQTSFDVNSGTERRHNIQESADKIQLKTEIKRGTETRDQDQIKVRVKGNEPAQVVAKLETTLSLLGDTVDTVRTMQAEEEDDA